jgi:hypothetical protein
MNSTTHHEQLLLAGKWSQRKTVASLVSVLEKFSSNEDIAEPAGYGCAARASRITDCPMQLEGEFSRITRTRISKGFLKV